MLRAFACLVASALAFRPEPEGVEILLDELDKIDKINAIGVTGHGSLYRSHGREEAESAVKKKKKKDTSAGGQAEQQGDSLFVLSEDSSAPSPPGQRKEPDPTNAQAKPRRVCVDLFADIQRENEDPGSRTSACRCEGATKCPVPAINKLTASGEIQLACRTWALRAHYTPGIDKRCKALMNSTTYGWIQEYQGELVINKTGTYTFQLLTNPKGSAALYVGHDTLVLESLCGGSSLASVHLKEGAQHIRVVYADYDHDHPSQPRRPRRRLALKYMGPDTTGASGIPVRKIIRAAAFQRAPCPLPVVDPKIPTTAPITTQPANDDGDT